MPLVEIYRSDVKRAAIRGRCYQKSFVDISCWGGGSSSSSRSPVEAFLLAVVGRGCNERAVRDVWGFKEWFPAAHHSSPRPVKGPSSPRPVAVPSRSLHLVVLSAVFTPGPRMDLFREELPRRVGVQEERSPCRGR